jgi:AcrR family transcriptional regulator
MNKDKSETRSYSSSLRSSQKDFTRSLIMKAVASLVAEGRIHTFSVQDVAHRAEISYASVYNHFPTRESLLLEMYEWASEMAGAQMPPVPRTIDEIPRWVEKSIPVFEEHAVVTQATVTALAALNIHPQSKQRRDSAIKKMVAEGVPGLSPQAARRAAAIIRYLAGSHSWAVLRQQFGLDAADTAAALTWALQVLIRDLKTNEACRDR